MKKVINTKIKEKNIVARRFKRKFYWFVLSIMLAGILIIYYVKVADNYPWKRDLQHRPDFFGVTFSTKFCDEIGLDWREAYLALLDDLKVKQIRLPIYWDEIEQVEGLYDFSDYDYMISEGEKRGVKFIINIGWRLPRWPECHAPAWAQKKSLMVTQARTLKMIQNVVTHYQDRTAIVSWQIENEPFFDYFGVCPPSDPEFFGRELALVKKLDNRPIVVSATGELSWWRREAKVADIFGSTLYRVVWGPESGYLRYPIPAWFYRAKAALAGIDSEKRIIIELQAEPWVPNGNMIYLPDNEANKSFNIDQFRANLQYAINVDFQKAYLWGVEWWFYQYKNGDPRYWELAKTMF